MNKKIHAKLLYDDKMSLNEISERLSGKFTIPQWTIFIFIALYFVFSTLIKTFSMSDMVFIINGTYTPLSSFVGVIALAQNAVLILTALLYGKKGFFVSLGLILFGTVTVSITILYRHVYSSINGLFSYIIALGIIIFFYQYNKKLEKYQNEISAQAVTDSLTGLPNRRAGINMVKFLTENCDDFALAIIDIRNFKNINETLGHTAGNSVLTEIAARLRNIAEGSHTGTKDFIARYGGDEFAVIIRNYNSEADILDTIRSYIEAINQRIDISDFEYFSTAVCGFTVFPDDSRDADTLFSFSDNALYAAKHSAETNICRYIPEMSRDSERALELERLVRKALDDDRVTFNLQPQYDIDHNLCGFEALARMHDSDGRFVSPGDFIPAAEKAGIIDQIDRRVIHRSAEFFGEIIRETGNSDITLSVNVSVLHLLRKDFISELKDILQKYGIPPSQLEIEITESVMVGSAEKAIQRIEEIKDMGLKIAIDDFGTGYSSLSYLNSFPADVLKVDKSFIDKMNTSDSCRQYVSSIISIGHIMNFRVISEGVEEPDQLDTLRDIGCDMIQGYIWGRPLPPDDAGSLVKDQSK